MTKLLRHLPSALGLAVLTFFASAIYAPQVLAFPHKLDVAGSTVWYEASQDTKAIERVVKRANALVAATPISNGQERKHIFLTDGGWRWNVLALNARRAFGLTRPLTDPVIIVNRSDAAKDMTWRDDTIASERRLSGVIAHEAMHGVLRDRYGIVATALAPQWLVEGYCDYVTGDSSLSDEEAAYLERENPSHPALPYYHGHNRVTELLEANGGDVDALFAEEG